MCYMCTRRNKLRRVPNHRSFNYKPGGCVEVGAEPAEVGVWVDTRKAFVALEAEHHMFLLLPCNENLYFN